MKIIAIIYVVMAFVRMANWYCYQAVKVLICKNGRSWIILLLL